MARAVRFDAYGDRDVYYIADVDIPTPGPGDVVVRVKAAGINPGEIAIRSGAMREMFPGTLPSGQGSDFAGIVHSVADDVSAWAVGDEVLGWCWTRESQADFVEVPAASLVRKPGSLDWERAGALYVVGCTAYAAVHAVNLTPGDVVAVSGAAGGVGTLVVQLLKLRGANVVGIASASNHDWLREHGVTPVAYGDGLAERLRSAAPRGIDAFIDLFGPQYVALAVELGIPPQKIETIISFAAAEQYGTKAEGSSDFTTTAVLEEMADLVASGQIELPIARTYPLEQVKDAFAELEDRHTRGKIVLVP